MGRGMGSGTDSRVPVSGWQSGSVLALECSLQHVAIISNTHARNTHVACSSRITGCLTVTRAHYLAARRVLRLASHGEREDSACILRSLRLRVRHRCLGRSYGCRYYI